MPKNGPYKRYLQSDYFSRFGYLFAFYRSKIPIFYRLDLPEKVEEIDKPKDRYEEFNFQKWSEQSFGIFH